MSEALTDYAGLRHEVLSRAESDALLAKYARARDDAAAGKRGAGRRAKALADRVVRVHLRFVVGVARRFSGLPLEDRVGHGVLGLLRALEKFDPSLGNAFITYAAWWVRQSIRRAIHDTARSIRLPVELHDERARLQRARVAHLARYGVEPTPEQLARIVRLSAGRARAVLGIASLVSLDAPVGGDESISLHEAIASDAPDPLEALLAKERETEARKARAALEPRQRTVVEARFGDEPKTLESIGAGLLGGLSRERARQLERVAMARLRKTVNPALRRLG